MGSTLNTIIKSDIIIFDNHFSKVSIKLFFLYQNNDLTDNLMNSLDYYFDV